MAVFPASLFNCCPIGNLDALQMDTMEVRLFSGAIYGFTFCSARDLLLEELLILSRAMFEVPTYFIADQLRRGEYLFKTRN